MKNVFLFLALILTNIVAKTCPYCQKQVLAPFRNIAHNGALPESNWDYVIVWIAVVIVAATLIFSVKWLIRPGERSEFHIKRFILNFE